MPTTEQILKQSEVAYNQWCKQWREHAKFHSRFEQKSMLQFQNIGIGKAVVAIANGYSFEQNIDIIKKYRDNVDIICVDKCLINLIENGIEPDYCIVCDANVNYEKYLKPIEDKLQNTTMFINVCANPKWSSNGNWKDIFFFVNMDILKSENEFCELSGCQNIIAAGTNVSNAQLILLTQSDNRGRNNFFGYDKILLVGYDYCWGKDSYYAFDKTGDGKSNYMKTTYCFNLQSNFCFTSTNLLFSAKWADQYIRTFNITAIQCSDNTLLHGKKLGNLEEQMQYRYKADDSNVVKDLLQYRKELQARIEKANSMIFQIGRDHYKQVIRTT